MFGVATYGHDSVWSAVAAESDIAGTASSTHTMRAQSSLLTAPHPCLNVYGTKPPASGAQSQAECNRDTMLTSCLGCVAEWHSTSWDILWPATTTKRSAVTTACTSGVDAGQWKATGTYA
jgi:hypothetical protein